MATAGLRPETQKEWPGKPLSKGLQSPPPAPLGAEVQTVTRITETTVEVDQLGGGVRIVGVTSTKQETQVALENSFVTYANPRITTTKIAI